MAVSDVVNLSVSPNSSVGVGTSTAVRVKKLDTGKSSSILSDSVQQELIQLLIQSLLATTILTLEISRYSSGMVASGLTTGHYYVLRLIPIQSNFAETYTDLLLFHQQS